MKNFNTIINLSLLDDSINTDFYEGRPWEELFKNAVAKKTLEEAKEKEALQKKALLEEQEKQTQYKNQTQQKEHVAPLKVFRQPSTLRDMLKEYNGRRTHLAPIKTPVSSFETEQSLELISIPNIPGKILRPAS